MIETAVISGATQGIGKELAVLLAEKGVRLLLLGRNKKALQELAKVLPQSSLGAHELVAGDLSDEKTFKSIGKVLSDRFGAVDALVNNAGVNHVGKIEEISLENVRHAFEINVFAAIRLTQIVLPFLEKGKAKKILNVSSVVGVMGVPGRSIYSASKYALEGFSAALSNELNSRGIDVLVIRPAGVSTGFHENTQSDGHTPRSTLSVKTPAEIAREMEKMLRLNIHSRAPGTKNKLYQFLVRIAPGIINWGLRRRFQKESG